MAFKLHHRGFALAIVPLVLLAGWLFLYGQSHTVDTTAQNQTLALLKDLKQLDSDWSADLLRSHAGIHRNYDALAEPLKQFADSLAQLRSQAGQWKQPALDDALADIGTAVDAKTALIEDFKAQNSLYKNSLRYMPTAHHDIQARRREPGAFRLLSRQTEREANGLTALDGQLAILVNSSLRYSAMPDDEVAQGLRSGIDELRSASAPYPAQVREELANLLSHLDKDLATRDDLTRVHNRRHLGELLQQHQAMHTRNGWPMCVALLDIDLFKSINDRFGHAAGDAVLVRFAATAGHTFRAVDLLGRWGGEEFLVALPQATLQQAQLALQRFRNALATADFADLGHDLRVSFSAGLVLLRADETIAAAVERADHAMYRAKSAGRNRVEQG